MKLNAQKQYIACLIIFIISHSALSQEVIPLLRYDFDNAAIGDKEAPPAFVEESLVGASNFTVEQGPRAWAGNASVQNMWYGGGQGMWFMHASVSPYPTDYNRFKFSLSSNEYPIAVTSMSFKIAHNYYWYVYYGEMDFVMEFRTPDGDLVGSFVTPRAPTGRKSSFTFNPTDFVLDTTELIVTIRANSRISGWVSPYTSQFYIDDVEIDGYSLVTPVDIDILPGSDKNPINTRSKGVIPVAVLSTETFDATMIDPDTVLFGPGAATKAHKKAHLEDVDGDGDLDLMLHFKTQAVGLTGQETSLCLMGATFDGGLIDGCDVVRVR